MYDPNKPWHSGAGWGGAGHKVYDKLSVGIELELEVEEMAEVDPYSWTGGQNKTGTHWTIHGEDSLRGGYELVLGLPQVPGTEGFDKHMSYLSEHLNEWGKDYIVSPRTSLHIHVNVQHYTYRQIYNIVLHVFLFENLLSWRCSDNRKGNLFCVRGCDAEAGLFLLAEGIKQGYPYFQTVTPENYKYGALNLATIRGLGTVEFRFMDATKSAEEIDMWASGLSLFVDRAANTDIYNTISKIRNDVFDVKSEFKGLTGSYFEFFSQGIPFETSKPLSMINDNILGIINVSTALNRSSNFKRRFSYVDDEGLVVNPPPYGVYNSVSSLPGSDWDEEVEEHYED